MPYFKEYDLKNKAYSRKQTTKCLIVKTYLSIDYFVDLAISRFDFG